MGETRWLTDDEQHAWRQLVRVVLRLPGLLERQLQRDASMSHFEYWVLALLSERPDRRIRLGELAALADASLSRLSHVMTRLERRGWVLRDACLVDARVTFAVLTDAGYDQVVAAAPGHVEAVRNLVFDALDPDDVDDLARICAAIAKRLEAGSAPACE